MYEENCSKTLLLSFYLFSEQNVFIYNFILFKFVTETKLFEAWAYCLQTNFIFLIFFQINIFAVMFNGNLKNV